MDGVERALDPALRGQHALDLAFRHLARRDRTVEEVRRHLERRGIEPAAVEAALAELEAGGYLDDARYATRFAEDRRRLDHWGADRIERALLAHGVDRELVAAALSSRELPSELDAARALLERRFARGFEDPRAQARALGVLVRRGHDLEAAHDALRAHARRLAGER